MADGVLKVPVKINGGPNPPSLLKERELYVNTEDGILYYGMSGNKVGKVGVLGSDENLYKFSGNTAKFGGLSATTNGTGYTLKATGGNGSVVLDGVKLASLLLDDSNYGPTLPTDAVEGQLFFYVPDNQ